MARYCVARTLMVTALFGVGCGTSETGEAGSGGSTAPSGSSDLDADGVEDALDNCPQTKNSGQEDGNQNGRGDACDDVPRFSLELHDPEKSSEGITLIPTSNYLAAVPNAPLAGNELVPISIYSDSVMGDYSDVDLLSDGRILTTRGPDAGDSLVAFDPTGVEGQTVYDEVMVNHAAQELPDGTFLFIYTDTIEHEEYGLDIDDDGAFELRIDSLRVIDENQQTIWDWSLWNEDPNAAGSKNHVYYTEWWSNCNSVTFVAAEDWTDGSPLEGDVYLNCRLLSRIYKINYPSGNIEWIMGDEGDMGEGFFYRAHDIHVTFDVDETGHRTTHHVLLYDNREGPPWGNAPPCPPDETCPSDMEPFSRIIVIDVSGTNAEVTWKWPRVGAPNFDQVRYYSPYAGGVQRLPNGNLLITNAMEGGNIFAGEPARSRIIEIAPNDSPSGADIVWDLRFVGDFGSYKAHRVPANAAENWQSRITR